MPQLPEPAFAAPGPAGAPCLVKRHRRGGWTLLLVSAWLLLGLAACAAPPIPPTDTGPEGSRLLDEMDPAQRETAREELRSSLMKGVGAYRLSAGDTLDVLYLNNAQPADTPFRIGVGDRLKVEFHFVEEAPRQLLVRPDGYVTLPVKGDIRAAGKTPPALAEEIRRAFSDIYRDLRVTVVVEQYTSRIEELRVALASSDRGRAQRVVVSPDGRVFLPFLPSMPVSGLTVDEMREQINQRYRQDVGNLEVSVLLDGVNGNRVMVFGEVQRPGVVPLTGNMTVLQAVASVGGVLPTGAMSQVKVLYWSPGDQQPRLRTVDLNRIVHERRLEEDMVLPGNTTIYVPPSGLTAVGRFIDQTLRQMFLFNGTSIGISYMK